MASCSLGVRHGHPRWCVTNDAAELSLLVVIAKAYAKQRTGTNTKHCCARISSALCMLHPEFSIVSHHTTLSIHTNGEDRPLLLRMQYM
jgi:hypothetical protein